MTTPSQSSSSQSNFQEFQAFAALLNLEGGTSFIYAKPTAQRGELQTGNTTRRFTYLSKVGIKEMEESDAVRSQFFEAFRNGVAGIQRSNGRLALTGKASNILSKVNFAILNRRRQSNQALAAIEEDQSTKSMDKSKTKTVASASNPKVDEIEQNSAEIEQNSEEIGHKVDSDIDEQEAEQVSEFDIISEEVYAKFLAQINKITNPEKETDKDESLSSKDNSSNNLSTQKTYRKQTKSRTLTKPINKTEHISSTETDDSARIIGKEGKRRRAAEEKDEIADQKKRDFIKSDIKKAEIKTKSVNDSLIIDQDINELELKKMLHNNEINKAAMDRLLECANLDGKFLKNMHEEGLINIDAYKKLMGFLH
jgi:hypothetical protein